MVWNLFNKEKECNVKIKHTIILRKGVYSRSEVKKILNDLTSIHNLDLQIQYGSPKNNRRPKVKRTNK